MITWNFFWRQDDVHIAIIIVNFYFDFISLGLVLIAQNWNLS